MNAKQIGEMNHGNEAHEGAHKHEQSRGNKMGVKRFAWAPFKPDHCEDKGQANG